MYYIIIYNTYIIYYIYIIYVLGMCRRSADANFFADADS